MRLTLGSEFFNNEILKPGVISFLNFSSLKTLKDKNIDVNNIIFFCDGMLLALLISILTKKKFRRYSFDFTSVADNVFMECIKSGHSVYFVGGDSHQIANFTNKIKCKYKELKIAGFSDGYFSNWDEKADLILSTKPDIVIVSMGAGNQEKMSLLLHSKNRQIKVFTSGGFVRQISDSNNSCYYPKWVNKVKLRAFYRMWKEPHTIIRYIYDYPISIYCIVKEFYSGNLIIEKH